LPSDSTTPQKVAHDNPVTAKLKRGKGCDSLGSPGLEHSASNKSMNPSPAWIHRFLDPDLDHPKECTQSRDIHCKFSGVRVEGGKAGPFLDVSKQQFYQMQNDRKSNGMHTTKHDTFKGNAEWVDGSGMPSLVGKGRLF